MTMDEPHSVTPDVCADRGILDRSQQAARFLDLTRQHGLVDEDDDDDILLPLVVSHLHGSLADEDATSDDVSIDSAAIGLVRPGSIPAGTGLDGYSLDDDDDGDVFGDGNGFGSGTGFGVDDD